MQTMSKQNYSREESKEDKWKLIVEKALVRYKGNVYDVSAGYDILRYIDAGLIGSKGDQGEFDEWSPSNPAYVFLRQALKGQLYYKGFTYISE